MIHQDDFHIETAGDGHMHDITAQVAQIVSDAGIRTGTAHVFNVGSTGVGVSEVRDPRGP